MVDPAMLSQPDRRHRSTPLLRTMLGDVLRRTRLEQRRTLADVARIARVSMPYLSELERGRKEASSEVLAALCGALRIELADLLAEVGYDLTHHRDRRRSVLRLDSIRGDRRMPPLARRPGHIQPDPADVPGGPGAPSPGPADAMGASTEAQCLLAA